MVEMNFIMKYSSAESNPDLQINVGVDKNAPNLIGAVFRLDINKNNMLWNDRWNYMTCSAALLRDLIQDKQPFRGSEGKK